MKLAKNLILLFFITFGCTLDPSPTLITFKICNMTENTLLIESESINENSYKRDTLLPNQKINFQTINFNCYKGLNDSLIQLFFKKISIKCANKNLNIELFKTSSWKESKEMNRFGECKRGKVTYTLFVNDSNLK